MKKKSLNLEPKQNKTARSLGQAIAISQIPIMNDTEMQNNDILKHIRHDFPELTNKKQNFIAKLANASPYLYELIRENHETTRMCFEKTPTEAFKNIIEKINPYQNKNQSNITAHLRIIKRQAALVIALNDLAGVWETEAVMDALSIVAQQTLNAALNHILTREAEKGNIHINPKKPAENAGITVIAMGKFGAMELNYSSDIDLMILYDQNAKNLAQGHEPQTFYVRLTRQLVTLMTEKTKNGYVFRTDLNLRPDPASTPIAVSTDSAIIYYESMGRTWERAALIKARPVAGDIELGEKFLAEIKPFIFRKSIDYTMIDEIHQLKKTIHKQKGYHNIAVNGHDIKLGRGGIRDIEFFVQTFQLIDGGFLKTLRNRKTINILQILQEMGRITPQTAYQLSEAYQFLRRIEHRIQMIDDAQNHTIPKQDNQLKKFAQFAGFTSTEDFAKNLTQRLKTVCRHYDDLFEQKTNGQVHNSDPQIANKEPPHKNSNILDATLNVQIAQITSTYLIFTQKKDIINDITHIFQTHNFKKPRAAADIFLEWKSGSLPALQSAHAKEKLNRIQGTLIRAISHTIDPDACLRACDRFLRKIPPATQIFEILYKNPKLISLLVKILGNAHILADMISERPTLFENILEEQFFENILKNKKINTIIQRAVNPKHQTEIVLDKTRIIAAEIMFQIGCQRLIGSINAKKTGKAYTILAESVIHTLFNKVYDDFAQIHGKIPNAHIAILAMGKLGGKEMTATSDLDLMIVTQHENTHTTSNGHKPLNPHVYFNRLVRRLITAVSSPTSQGKIYDIDMRLRPSGTRGPITTQLNSLIDYHKNSAWTWEKLSICRARPIAGDQKLKSKLNAEIKKIIKEKNNPDKIKKDVKNMRNKIFQQKKPENIWDVKHINGGLIDVEFIIQTLQILHAHHKPKIIQTNNHNAIRALTQNNVISKKQGTELENANHLYQIIIQARRLNHHNAKASEELKYQIKKTVKSKKKYNAETIIKNHARNVARIFEKIIGNPEII